MIEKTSSHSTEIERVTRASEMALRKANMNKLMSEPHERKLTRSSALVGEFVETRERILQLVGFDKDLGERLRQALDATKEEKEEWK